MKSAASSPNVQPAVPGGEAIARRAALVAWEKKAEDILVLDVRGLCEVTDYFVLASAGSDVHVEAVSEGIEEALVRDGARPMQVEGRAARRWVLLDYVDCVVHVFYRETREYYGLERLWGDAPAKVVGERGDLAPVADPAGAVGRS